MRKTVNILLVLLLLWSCRENETNDCEQLSGITGLVRSQSLYSDSLDWSKIQAFQDSICKHKPTGYKETFALHVIKQLRNAGDKHSFFMSDSLRKKIKNLNLETTPSGKVIEKNIGYLEVPGFMSFDKKKIADYADTLQKLIKIIDQSQPIAGWIVDLRDNHGGDMWPMIAGLGPLLGNGTAGYFERPLQRNRVEWNYNNGRFGSIQVHNFYELLTPGKPIAFLISNRTTSSGEMTMIAFLGKPNVKSFGIPTGGFVTANTMFPLADSSILTLATAYVADRKGTRYVDSIRPDIHIESVAADHTDRVLNAARDWIHSKP